MIFLYKCQQNLIQPDKSLKTILEFICSQSHRLTNCGIYYARQIFFKTGKIIKKFDLINEYKNNKHYQALHSQAAQQTLLSVFESFKSFKALNSKYRKGELEDKPRLPKYRKSGLVAISYPKQALKIVEGQIQIPLGTTINRWFSLKNFLLPMSSNLNCDDIKELRIVPRNRCFYVEFVYQSSEIEKQQISPDRCLGIDTGIGNWLTCVSNVGTSFIIDGRHLKSVNQFYNKQIATIKQNKPQGFWSKRLAAITEKRNRRMHDAVNKAARLVIDNCLKHGIGTLVFGWNKGQRQEVNLGTKTNQTFVQIPTAKLKNRISQLCEHYGIEFVETEESYTSKASFLDNDFLPKYGEKPVTWKESGKRVKRGLYHTANNILRKVKTTLGLNLDGVYRGALTTPLRVRFWASSESPRL
ncbi:IS200/IS605 family element transposase accessory protein TnpB [Anabaena cylindrica FACHB-243]|uniref:Transposase, IS605 OrfB family n=1 Tax=Anabaena cylindrica (strain ATCC 27899 / PCC 7122) TaxID=272123 RepID=K9ZCJ5_ANACC|nr:MULTISPECIES: RNA-guided endonuclease TnpB family protein [Anabaena]AFZ56444.1 transposase, IS605 OrfB family [Anabaena cylindrica PCC 7122]MBD2418105.1 IS200/IS605 family element transposase accessory protein TnpB [Anabaena cylindrica FACHB-243]MBY5281951.1 IS200/IS605 family element transposase accessory protein TnpB [Anabaena sp. CCAP 1446/1C]MBY5310835.1 IS200/IS605 family element transposase accessory protein TnpB [Anabaena sp. CCAP 1446/1C]MCM2407383.1 RNA-guided endonuclease TnpB fam